MYKILRKENLAPAIKLMDIYAPKVAEKAKAGQFIILRINEKGERIPLTIADYNREKGIITIIYQEMGATTMHLGTLEVGDFLLDFVGPLGVPAEIKKYGKVVCVGGGVGIAPIHCIAKALKEAGNEVISIVGSRSENYLFFKEEMLAVSDKLMICTDDGSYGHKGFVTDLLKQAISENNDIKIIWAIGPMIMMKFVAALTKPEKIKTMVSMNPIMVDGTGMCGSCRVVVDDKTKFACVDGPEFDGHLVDWDLALQRSAGFKDEEKVALEMYQKCSGRGGCGCQK